LEKSRRVKHLQSQADKDKESPASKVEYGRWVEIKGIWNIQGTTNLRSIYVERKNRRWGQDKVSYYRKMGNRLRTSRKNIHTWA